MLLAQSNGLVDAQGSQTVGRLLDAARYEVVALAFLSKFATFGQAIVGVIGATYPIEFKGYSSVLFLAALIGGIKYFQAHSVPNSGRTRGPELT